MADNSDSHSLPPGESLGASSAMTAIIEHWRQRANRNTVISFASAGSLALSGTVTAPLLPSTPDGLLQAAIITRGNKDAEGELVVGVSIAWFEIITEIEKDPKFLYKLHWRQWEEMIAGAYEREGW